MREIKIAIAAGSLFFALLFFWSVCINFKFSSDLPITIVSCWLVGISWFLIAKRNRPLSKKARSLFLLNFGLCNILLLVVGIPNFIQARATSCGNACINNLRQIDAAKEQWAMANNKTEADTAPTFADLIVTTDLANSYIKATPLCKSNGTYTVAKIGTNPSCSYANGHNL